MDQHPSFWGDGHDEHHVTSKSFAAMFGLGFEPAFPLCPSSRDFRGRNIFDLTFTYVFFVFLPFSSDVPPIEEVNCRKRWPHSSCRSCCWTIQASALNLGMSPLEVAGGPVFSGHTRWKSLFGGPVWNMIYKYRKMNGTSIKVSI